MYTRRHVRGALSAELMPLDRTAMMAQRELVYRAEKLRGRYVY